MNDSRLQCATAPVGTGRLTCGKAQRLILIVDYCSVELNRMALEANATRTHRVLGEGDLEWGRGSQHA